MGWDGLRKACQVPVTAGARVGRGGVGEEAHASGVISRGPVKLVWKPGRGSKWGKVGGGGKEVTWGL